jgi:hypothetical protein
MMWPLHRGTSLLCKGTNFGNGALACNDATSQVNRHAFRCLNRRRNCAVAPFPVLDRKRTKRGREATRRPIQIALLQFLRSSHKPFVSFCSIAG